jgi:hypothetical protein
LELFKILHGASDCSMDRTIVASHRCLENHYIVTWNFLTVFELWWDSPDLGFEFLKNFEYTGSIMTYDDATIISEEFFDDWLESLGK